MKLSLLGILATALLSLSAFAGADFNSATWAQGGPYSMEGIKGKVVLLYFFEEG